MRVSLQRCEVRVQAVGACVHRCTQGPHTLHQLCSHLWGIVACWVLGGSSLNRQSPWVGWGALHPLLKIYINYKACRMEWVR